MSLRTRLIAGLLALTAIGLLIAGGATYATQRSFLLDRVDQQLQGAAGPNAPGRFDGGYDPDRALPATPPGGRGKPDLPSGTVVLRRDADGTATGWVSGFGNTPTVVPELPSSLTAGSITTVSAAGDSGDQFRVLLRRFDTGASTVVAIPLAETDRALDRLLRVEGIVIAGVLLALGILGSLLVRIGLRPLDRIGATAGAIAAGDLSRRVSPATSRTEVGRLGLSLNRMLGRLEEAFAEREASEQRLRRFIADASHELRTPLASIRGYAELFRMGAASDPEQTARSMGRIEGEAQRMGVLVEDLLTLARLDEVREAATEPVDLGRLAADAAADARATEPNRPIGAEADPGAIVSGDSHQLRQVLANLLRNALVHTPAGTPVEVSVRRTDGAVRLEVRDHGHGLPADDGDVLFERFWRAEGGRERGRAGAGLGLAIVAGIVTAHGGTVHADNHPGGGARFTVTLPERGPEPEDPYDGDEVGAAARGGAVGPARPSPLP